jgi:hypothetical protein
VVFEFSTFLQLNAANVFNEIVARLKNVCIIKVQDEIFNEKKGGRLDMYLR